MILNKVKINLCTVLGANFVYGDLEVPHYIVAKKGNEIRLYKASAVLSPSMTRRIVKHLLSEEATIEEQVEQFLLVADFIPKPKVPNKTASSSFTEYRVLTECGRNFAWSATDMEHLFRSMADRGYFAKHVQLMSEYEAELEAQYQQERLVRELQEAIEKGDAA